MKKLLFLITIFVSFLPILVSAHPGNTDSYGCHTCRTNCESWGLSYGEYHCHSDYIPECYPPVVSDCDVGSESAMQARRGLIGSDFGQAQTSQCQEQHDAYVKRNEEYQECLVSMRKGISTPIVTAPKTETCADPNAYNADGICRCKNGFVLWSTGDIKFCTDITKVCLYDYGIFSEKASGNTCKCKEGYIFNSNKNECIPYCGQNQNINSENQFRCLCNEGYVISKDGNFCISILEKCKENFGKHAVLFNQNDCTCGTGYELNLETKKCIEKEEEKNTIIPAEKTTEELGSVRKQLELKYGKTTSTLREKSLAKPLTKLENKKTEDVLIQSASTSMAVNNDDVESVTPTNTPKKEKELPVGGFLRVKSFFGGIFKKLKFW